VLSSFYCCLLYWRWGDEIDPLTAIAVAKTAVTTIKAGLKLHGDVQSLIKDFSKFQDCKDVIEEAAKEEEKKHKKNKSISQQAMHNVMLRKQMRDYEAKLRETFMWSGQSALYSELQAEKKRLKKLEAAEVERQKYKKRLIIQRFKEGSLLAALMLFTSYVVVTVINMILDKIK